MYGDRQRVLRSANRVLFILLLLAPLLVICRPAPADVVYLKDGFALHGKVRGEADPLIDPVSGLMIQLPKGNFIVDDRVRLVVFSPRIVQEPDPNVNIRGDFIEFSLNQVPPQQGRLPGSAGLESMTPFDSRWQRTVRLKNEQGPWTINQRLTSLTPYAARVQSTQFHWNMSYLTQELGLNTVKKLLDEFPDPKGSNVMDVEKRMRRFRFLLQAGWPLAADEELETAAKEFPDEKDRIERGRTALKQAKTLAFWEEIDSAHKAGRHRYVGDILRRLPIGELPERIAAEATALRAKYETWEQQTKDVYHLVEAIGGRFVGPPRLVFAEAGGVIRAELGPANLERLEAFLTLGNQHEQELKAGRAPTYTDEAILSLAVTGWVLGREASEPRIDTAERLWASRAFALDYLRTPDSGARRRALDEYQKKNALGPDEMAQMIAMLPPPEPAPVPNTPNGVEARETQSAGGSGRNVRYLLQLPPEYRVGRSYPVLVVLAGGREPPAEALTRWSMEAAKNGYILAAPEWIGVGGNYNYTSEEHAAVTELVVDLRRHYAVDSDRVFLTGYGEGGTMAFDVGMSHPDLFAGVVPINGRPKRNATTWYWRNAQYLPFYIVAGELAGDTISLDRFVFENWMSRGYPSLMTIYRGRPMEFFFGEMPFAFDWMNRKKRATGFPELGRNPNGGANSEEFQTMRAADNRFYWISAEEINERNLNALVGSKIGTPAAFTAQIRDNNHIVINSRGIKRMRIWLGRVWDQQSGARNMIDFTKPVKVTVNRVVGRDRPVTPSLATMLEDLYQRGDRQRLFLAYVELTGLQ